MKVKIVPNINLFLFAFMLINSSCEKEYKCVCHDVSYGRDTIIDKVKTTELGYKGYKDYCNNQSKDSTINCQVK